MSAFRLTIEDGKFRDDNARTVVLRGINVSGDCKLPSEPSQPSHIAKDFFDGDTVTFHQRPFTMEDAHIHFGRIKRYGFNCIRYLFTWEAIEAAGPGKYDEEFIQHTIEVLRIAKSFGFYVFMDPHQDVWSRFTGGSGAPMWTLYAAGLNPEAFVATEAAIVHNTWPNPDEFPKMIWSTNYFRLAAGTMFTLFFAGKDFAPKAIIDGVNIQDYLQGHFVKACAHLAQRIHEAGDLEEDVVIGWESMNEPNRGMTGYVDLTVIPKEHPLKKGTCPTMWQTLLTGMGRACEVETWDMGGMGPYKTGKKLVDPQGVKAWLPADYDDSRYGWKRDPGWKLNECLWAQHGVWDPSTDTILRKDYFSKEPGTGRAITHEHFTNTYFMNFWRNFKTACRSVHKDCIMLMQFPTLELPPEIKGTEDAEDTRMAFTPHYYDGITLMTKHWNSNWNVDVVGVLRGKYWSPVFAIRIGETAIRNCFKDQLATLRKEGLDRIGNRPCILTEFGIPYDMDEKKAYKTGDYSSQSAALDANFYAVEGANLEGACVWCYTVKSDHLRGDQWNGEDLSIFSAEDKEPPNSALPLSGMNYSTPSLVKNPIIAQEHEVSDGASVTPSNIQRALATPSISSSRSGKDPELTANPGYRAAEAYIRPYPTAVVGEIVSYGFNLRKCSFELKIDAPRATTQPAPTTIFLPEYHFPKDQCSVTVSGGKWEIKSDENEGVPVQRLRWWHAEGEQELRVDGVQRPYNSPEQSADDAGYLEQCQQGSDNCSIM